MGIESHTGVKQPGRGVDHPPHIAPTYLYSPSGPSWLVPTFGNILFHYHFYQLMETESFSEMLETSQLLA